MELQYNEAKRSKIWKAVMISSSILIVLIGIYLAVRLFAHNPLEGRWQYEDGDILLIMKNKRQGIIHLQDLEEGKTLDIKVDCTINKDEKTLSIRENQEEIERLVKKGHSREALETQMSVLTNTFDYNVEKDRLILSEREYGDQLVFLKK